MCLSLRPAEYRDGIIIYFNESVDLRRVEPAALVRAVSRLRRRQIATRPQYIDLLALAYLRRKLKHLVQVLAGRLLATGAKFRRMSSPAQTGSARSHQQQAARALPLALAPAANGPHLGPEDRDARRELIRILQTSRVLNSVLLASHSALLLGLLRAAGSPAPLTSGWLALVAAMDFANSLHWFHSMARVVPSRRRRFELHPTGWLRSAASMLASPRHLFLALHACLLVSLAGAFGGRLGLALNLHHSLNQAARHGYNLYRIARYSSSVAASERAPRPARRQSSGWSHWPARLPCAQFSYYFEKLQMLSQLMGVKVTIFALLVHIDTLELGASCQSVLLLACLCESFLAMHSYYDKFHNRYVHADEPKDE